MCVPDFFGDVQTCGLIGEGRRDWEEGCKYVNIFLYFCCNSHCILKFSNILE